MKVPVALKCDCENVCDLSLGCNTLYFHSSVVLMEMDTFQVTKEKKMKEE